MTDSIHTTPQSTRVVATGGQGMTMTSSQKVKVVTENLDSFIQFKAKMIKLGDDGRKQIATRKAEILAILDSFISEFESVQFTRVDQFRKFELESLRSQLVSLQLELKSSGDEVGKTEAILVAKRD